MNGYFEKIAPQIRACGVIPVFCPKNEAEFHTFIDSLLPTPLRVIEITLRSHFAAEAIARIKKEHPDFIVGAGTVLNENLLEQAANAGADFLVSPGCSSKLLELAQSKKLPFLPGCATPSEMQNALLDGYKTLKFFPAECSGGVNALKLYAGAFADLAFIPTGGITLKNLPDYLAQENVLACGGSFMLPKDLMAAGDSKAISQVVMNCLSIRGGQA